MKVYVIRVYAKGEKKQDALYVSQVDVIGEGTIYFSISVAFKYAIQYNETNVEKMVRMVKTDFGKNYSVFKEEV